jgi:hypothetical protein
MSNKWLNLNGLERIPNASQLVHGVQFFEKKVPPVRALHRRRSNGNITLGPSVKDCVLSVVFSLIPVIAFSEGDHHELER